MTDQNEMRKMESPQMEICNSKAGVITAEIADEHAKIGKPQKLSTSKRLF